MVVLINSGESIFSCSNAWSSDVLFFRSAQELVLQALEVHGDFDSDTDYTPEEKSARYQGFILGIEMIFWSVLLVNTFSHDEYSSVSLLEDVGVAGGVSGYSERDHVAPAPVSASIERVRDERENGSDLRTTDDSGRRERSDTTVAAESRPPRSDFLTSGVIAVSKLDLIRLVLQFKDVLDPVEPREMFNR